MLRSTLLCAALLLLIARPSNAQLTPPATQPVVDIPRAVMPDRVYDVLLKAVEAHTYRDEKLKQKNVEALATLKASPWPDAANLAWVELTFKGDGKRDKDEHTARTWIHKKPDGGVVLVRPDLSTAELPAERVIKTQSMVYARDVQQFVEDIKKPNPNRRPWDFTFFDDFGSGGLPFRGGVFLVHHAVWAAWLQCDDDAAALIEAALKQRESAIDEAVEERAWQGFNRGIGMLETMRPRSDVLDLWEQILRLYPTSSYAEDLEDLVIQLRLQVKADEELAKQPAVDPVKLGEAEQVGYYIARLGDVHGVQFSQPGHCITVGFGEGTKIADALVKIGRPAVPALIEQLSSRRATRSIGFWRNFAPSRTVLRYQDVAVQCIEHILDVRFYQSSSTSSYLSNEKPEVRDKVIADIKAYWKENAGKSPLEGQLARLETGRVYERIDTLHKVEKLDPKAVDPIATLKRWADTAKPNELPTLAGELANRKDLSLLPRIRKLVFDENYRDYGDGVWFLMRYGTADDLAQLRRLARAERAGGAKPGSGGIWGSVMGGLESSTRPEVVPIMTDYLECREMSGSRYRSGYKQSMSFSFADTAVESLIRMTGHDENYKGDDPPEARFTAMDKWLAWWNAEGKAAYLKAHPEIAPVLAAEEKNGN